MENVIELVNKCNNTYLINLRLYKSLKMQKQNLQCFFFLVFQFTIDLVATRTWLLTRKYFKLLKKNLQFTSQVIQIKPCGHHGRFFNKKQKKNLEDVNLMKCNLQISNIHD
jgi:hypothetical protein